MRVQTGLIGVDESVPSQQGLKHRHGDAREDVIRTLTSPFHHNKD